MTRPKQIRASLTLTALALTAVFGFQLVQRQNANHKASFAALTAQSVSATTDRRMSSSIASASHQDPAGSQSPTKTFALVLSQDKLASGGPFVVSQGDKVMLNISSLKQQE